LIAGPCRLYRQRCTPRTGADDRNTIHRQSA
jgi:hypothetical protein